RQPRWRPRRSPRPDRRRADPAADPKRHDVPQRGHEPRDRRPGCDPDRGRHVREPPAAAAGSPMTAAAAVPRASTLRRLDRLFRDRPVVPLVALLALLVVLYELARPGVVGPTWASGIVAFAIPLAILAGCQTLTMLTGGIDLSVGAV